MSCFWTRASRHELNCLQRNLSDDFWSFSGVWSLDLGAFPQWSIPANSPSNRMDIMIMRVIAATTAGLLFFTFHSSAAPADFEKLKADAEKQYADGSYALAHETYAKAPLADLPPGDKRWVEFRLADTQWRSQAATQTADTTKLDEARRQLEVLIRDITRVEDHNRIWAEVHESLGDYFSTLRNSNNSGE